MSRGIGVNIGVKGLGEAVESLKRIDGKLASELKRGIKEDARPVLESARGYARALGGSGDYAASMAMRAIRDGVRIKSSDPGAGTIEFANRGAFYLSGSRAGRPVGVPAGTPPRALARAAIEREAEVRRSVEARIERTIERYLNG